jgi:GT2 family glycosyltransferase
MMRSIAAVVPTYNRKAKTLRFIEAFLNQTYPALDLILVDSGSHDGTVEAVRDRMPQAHILEVSENFYWAAATNAGVQYALDQGYEAILTINDDCVIQPHYVEALVGIAQKHQAPIVGSRIDYLDAPELVWALGITLDWKKHLFCLTAQDCLFESLPIEIRQADLISTELLAGNGVLIDRRVYEAIGLYQAKYLPHYLADVEWTMRATRAGFPVRVTPKAIVYDDFPTPTQRAQLAASASQEKFLAALNHRLFNVRSGENIAAKCYVIWHYCPAALRPWAFLRRGLSILHWGLQYLQRSGLPQPTPQAKSHVQSLDQPFDQPFDQPIDPKLNQSVDQNLDQLAPTQFAYPQSDRARTLAKTP